MLNVVVLNVVMLNVIMLNVIIPAVIMLNVVIPAAIMLNVIMLNVIMLSVVAPYRLLYLFIGALYNQKTIKKHAVPFARKVSFTH